MKLHYRLVCLLIWFIACSCAPAHLTTTPSQPASAPALPASPTRIPAEQPQATIPSKLPETPPVLTTPELTATSLPDIPAPEPVITRTLYTLTATLDYAAGQVVVAQRIQTHLPTPPPAEIVLVVDPARRAGIFALASLQLNQTPVTLAEASDPGTLRFTADEYNGGKFDLHLEYTLQLPGYAAKLSAAPAQTNLVDWYAFLPPYASESGWLYHAPAPVGEYLIAPVADFSIKLRVLHAPANLQIAASSPGTPLDDGWYAYFAPGLRTFAFSLSDLYEVTTAEHNGVLISSYHFAHHRQAGQAALLATQQALELFGKLFGPYPLPSLSIVESAFPDGLELHGLYFLGSEYYAEYDRTPANYLTMLAAHETAHQWFAMQIGSDPAAEPWVDEALCTYTEHLFYETYYPELLSWWWQFRVDRFQPAGTVNGPVYIYSGFRQYVDAVYLRGAHWLHDTRLILGDTVFLTDLRDYAKIHSGKIVTGAELLALLAQSNPAAFDTLLSRYFSLP